jgi:hypothetical protein
LLLQLCGECCCWISTGNHEGAILYFIKRWIGKRVKREASFWGAEKDAAMNSVPLMPWDLRCDDTMRHHALLVIHLPLGRICLKCVMEESSALVFFVKSFLVIMFFSHFHVHSIPK